MSTPDAGPRRRRAHDAEGAREAILNAAEEVFAEHGFDGARIDAIAAAAGYNKSLIFQYYGGKLALYAAVIRRADDQTRAMQNEALATFMDADMALNPAQIREKLGLYVGWYFDYLLEHPRILRIYLWEMAEGWQTLSRVFTQRDYEDIDEFSPVLTRLQGAGLLRSAPHPLLQLSQALFSCALYLSLPPLYRVLMPEVDLSSPAAWAHARAFVIDFALNGLLVTPSETQC